MPGQLPHKTQTLRETPKHCHIAPLPSQVDTQGKTKPSQFPTARATQQDRSQRMYGQAALPFPSG